MKRRIVNIAVDESFRRAMRIKSAQHGKKMLDFSRDLAKIWTKDDEENTKKPQTFGFRF
jgi:hypothetical protein